MGALNTIMNVKKAEPVLKPSSPVRKRLLGSLEMQTEVRKQPTTVGRLLSRIQPGPSPSLLLGRCADGLPFLIDLGDPHMGAILVSCDQGAGKTHQLQVLADSAVRLNAPSDLQIGVLTFKPGEWGAWERISHRAKFTQGIFAWYDPWAESLIQNLVELAEARQDGRRTGADVLLILDDLNFIEELSFEAQVNLHWLLAYGSQANIWVVGAINAHQAVQFRYWVGPFRTRIIGKISSAANAELLALRGDSTAESLEHGMFRVWTGSGWQTYRLPLLGD